MYTLERLYKFADPEKTEGAVTAVTGILERAGYKVRPQPQGLGGSRDILIKDGGRDEGDVATLTVASDGNLVMKGVSHALLMDVEARIAETLREHGATLPYVTVSRASDSLSERYGRRPQTPFPSASK